MKTTSGKRKPAKTRKPKEWTDEEVDLLIGRINEAVRDRGVALYASHAEELGEKEVGRVIRKIHEVTRTEGFQR